MDIPSGISNNYGQCQVRPAAGGGGGSGDCLTPLLYQLMDDEHAVIELDGHKFSDADPSNGIRLVDLNNTSVGQDQNRHILLTSINRQLGSSQRSEFCQYLGRFIDLATRSERLTVVSSFNLSSSNPQQRALNLSGLIQAFLQNSNPNDAEMGELIQRYFPQINPAPTGNGPEETPIDIQLTPPSEFNVQPNIDSLG